MEEFNRKKLKKLINRTTRTILNIRKLCKMVGIDFEAEIVKRLNEEGA